MRKSFSIINFRPLWLRGGDCLIFRQHCLQFKLNRDNMESVFGVCELILLNFWGCSLNWKAIYLLRNKLNLSKMDMVLRRYVLAELVRHVYNNIAYKIFCENV